MDFIRFLVRVGVHWGALVTGGFGIGVLTTYQNVGHQVAPWIYWTIAGAAVFWACFLAWRDEYRKTKEYEDKLKAIEASANLMPVNHFHLPASPLPLPEPPKHNVQCVGVEMDPDFPIVNMCFRNIELPGRTVGEFRSARLKVNYTLESSGETVAEIFPVRWNGLDQDDIDIGFTTRCAILAMHFSTGWEALTTIGLPADYGWNYKVEHTPLPNGRLKIVANLIGENNLSLDSPIEGVLTLGQDGSASFTRI